MPQNIFRISAKLALTLMAAAVLVYVFHDEIFLGSVDTVHHFQMVDQFARFGSYTEADYDRIGDMVGYPPGAHWLAAMFVPFDPSFGLISMAMISVLCIFACYAMLGWLVQRDLSAISIPIFALLVIALSGTQTQIGWEIVGNFFYPQLVSSAVLFAGLCGLVLVKDDIGAAAVGAPLLALVAMSVHPIVALHILFSALCYLVFRALTERIKEKRLPVRATAAIFVVFLSLVAIVLWHPAFKTMRGIASNDGGLMVGYSHISMLVVPASIVALAILWIAFTRGSRTDAVIGSALTASIALIVLQDVAWLAFGQGSPYAVKKHLFIVTTLMVTALARLIGRAAKTLWDVRAGYGAAIVLSALLSAWIVTPALRDADPMIEALRYADKYASTPGFRPGDAYANDQSASQVANVATSVVGLRYPNKHKVFLAFYVGNPTSLAKKVMIRRSPEIDAGCKEAESPSETFDVVPIACLKNYALGTVIDFHAGGNSDRFISSGWNFAESGGRWSMGMPGGKLNFALQPEAKSSLRLDADAFALTPTESGREVHVLVNGKEVSIWTFSLATQRANMSAIIPAQLIEGGNIEISFVPDEVVIPGNGDPRELGIGLKTLSISPLN